MQDDEARDWADRHPGQRRHPDVDPPMDGAAAPQGVNARLAAELLAARSRVVELEAAVIDGQIAARSGLSDAVGVSARGRIVPAQAEALLEAFRGDREFVFDAVVVVAPGDVEFDAGRHDFVVFADGSVRRLHGERAREEDEGDAIVAAARSSSLPLTSERPGEQRHARHGLPAGYLASEASGPWEVYGDGPWWPRHVRENEFAAGEEFSVREVARQRCAFLNEWDARGRGPLDFGFSEVPVLEPEVEERGDAPKFEWFEDSSEGTRARDERLRRMVENTIEEVEAGGDYQYDLSADSHVEIVVEVCRRLLFDVERHREALGEELEAAVAQVPRWEPGDEIVVRTPWGDVVLQREVVLDAFRGSSRSRVFVPAPDGTL